MFSQRPNRNLQPILSGVGNVDQATAIVSLIPSSSDTYSSSTDIDAATAVNALIPSSSDILIAVDLNTAIILGTPSGIDVKVNVDSGTATIKITPLVYETIKAGWIHRVVPPKNSIEYAAYLLANLDREIERIGANKRPTMPIYDRTKFPQDAVKGQHAIATDGSLWAYNGSWNLIAGS